MEPMEIDVKKGNNVRVDSSHLEHVIIGDDTVVENAFIAGTADHPTVIGSNCRIGMSPVFGCQIEHAHIGDNVRIKDLTQIKFADIGDETTVARHVTVFGSTERPVRLGRHVQVCYGVYVEGICGVSVGDNVGLGVLDMFYSATGANSFSSLMENLYPYEEGEVRIADHCWIPSRSTILPGVTMDEGCIIAPHSVVPRGHYQAWTVYGGAPVRELKKLDLSMLRRS